MKEETIRKKTDPNKLQPKCWEHETHDVFYVPCWRRSSNWLRFRPWSCLSPSPPNNFKSSSSQSYKYIHFSSNEEDTACCIMQLALCHSCIIEIVFTFPTKHYSIWPVSHSARHQRPARERHIMRIASRENVDNQAPCNTSADTITGFGLLLHMDITILYRQIHGP